MKLTKCEECRRPWQGKIRRGRCEACYRRLITRLKREGAFVPTRTQPKLTLQDRLFSKVTPGWGGCWIYTGKIHPSGYGIIRERGVDKKTHRVAYASVIGPIPAGLELDHLCHSASLECRGGVSCIHRRCINPAHLEPVTRLENVRRGEGPSSINGRKTHCIHGHEFTPENTIVRPGRTADAKPERQCKACRRDRRKAAREKARHRAA